MFLSFCFFYHFPNQQHLRQFVLTQKCHKNAHLGIVNAEPANKSPGVISASKKLPTIYGTVPLARAEITPRKERRMISFLYSKRYSRIILQPLNHFSLFMLDTFFPIVSYCMQFIRQKQWNENISGRSLNTPPTKTKTRYKPNIHIYPAHIHYFHPIG